MLTETFLIAGKGSYTATNINRWICCYYYYYYYYYYPGCSSHFGYHFYYAYIVVSGGW